MKGTLTTTLALLIGGVLATGSSYVYPLTTEQQQLQMQLQAQEQRRQQQQQAQMQTAQMQPQMSQRISSQQQSAPAYLMYGPTGTQMFAPMPTGANELNAAGVPAVGTDQTIGYTERQRRQAINASSNNQKKKNNNKKKKQKSFEADCLAAHNKWRSLHRVGKLEFDRKIAAFAQKRADFIAGSDGAEFRHPPNLPYGENLAWHSRETLTCGELIKMWYDEVELYNFRAGQFSHETGHFTQLVWKSTTRVGCAKAISKGPKGGIYLVCNYDPPGNYLNEALENVFTRGPNTVSAVTPLSTISISTSTARTTSVTLPPTTTTTTTVAPTTEVDVTKKPNEPQKRKKNKKNKKKNGNKKKQQTSTEAPSSAALVANQQLAAAVTANGNGSVLDTTNNVRAASQSQPALQPIAQPLVYRPSAAAPPSVQPQPLAVV